MVEEQLSRIDWLEKALSRYQQPLLRHAFRITGDVELAQDVVQDTFLKLCKADRGRVDDHLTAWLYTVCRNRALDVMKKEGRMGRLDDAATVKDGKASLGDAAAQGEQLRVVLEVLESLSKEHREAFRLKFQDQLTYREISQVMGKSLGTVSRLISTALSAVRDRLRDSAEPAKES